MLRWLWCRPAATAPIRPLSWEPPYAVGAALEKAKKRRKKKKEREKVKKNITLAATLFLVQMFWKTLVFKCLK